MNDDSQLEPLREGEERFAALVEEYLAELNQPEGDPAAVRLRLLDENADIAAELNNRFRIIDVVHRSYAHENARLDQDRGRSVATMVGEQVSAVQCPQCSNQFRVLSQRILEATCASCGSVIDLSKPQQYFTTPERPAEIGNFKMLGLIGQGGFGAAYRAVDRRLGRIVAVKLPRAGRFLSLNERERFIREAKAAAGLRHPNIVQVHEISTTGEQPYIVSDYIDGPNLAEVLDGQMLEFAESVRIMIDARSDVYSLGVILYRMICGVIPFRGSQQMQLLQAIRDDPQTPRSIDHRVPHDLETIALKAMAKEQGRRYQSAQQFADDMQRWANFEPIHARRINSFEKLMRWKRRNPRIAALTGVIAGLLVVSSILATGWAIRETHLKTIADGITARAVASERTSRERLVNLRIQNGLNALENDSPQSQCFGLRRPWPTPWMTEICLPRIQTEYGSPWPGVRCRS